MFQIPSQTQVKVLPGCYEKSNLAPRAPAVPILDFSQSMSAHAPELPHVWSRMVAALSRRTTERLQIELACCVFDTHVLLQDYAPLPFYLETPLSFSGGGITSLGAALLTVIDATRRRRQLLADDGIHCRPAICPVVTDGYATDRATLVDALREMHVSQHKREMQFVFLAPDKDCMPQLRSVFHCDPISLDEISFDQLFEALTRSLSTYSCSQIGYEPEPRRLLLEELRGRDTEAE